jgi:hypothetical protein
VSIVTHRSTRAAQPGVQSTERRSHRSLAQKFLIWLIAALLSIALVAGCGGAGAADEVAGGAAKVVAGGADEGVRGAGAYDDAGRALPRLSQEIRPPASRLARSSGGGVSFEEVDRLMGSAFCEGWKIYRSHGAFPSS